MRFVVDASLPPALAHNLREAGHDAVFLADIGSPSAPDYRRTKARRATQLAMLLLSQLVRLEDELTGGAIVVIEEGRVRVRSLPIDYA